MRTSVPDTTREPVPTQCVFQYRTHTRTSVPNTPTTNRASRQIIGTTAFLCQYGCMVLRYVATRRGVPETASAARPGSSIRDVSPGHRLAGA
eukprot:2434730-Rhodomonas_salina.1